MNQANVKTFFNYDDDKNTLLNAFIGMFFYEAN
jgi:hypothetical protein